MGKTANPGVEKGLCTCTATAGVRGAQSHWWEKRPEYHSMGHDAAYRVPNFCRRALIVLPILYNVTSTHTAKRRCCTIQTVVFVFLVRENHHAQLDTL